MNTALTLSDLLGRGVSLEWVEAVAVVRAVADRCVASFAAADVAPELHEIQISPMGIVEISGASRTEKPVRRFGQLLQALISQSEAPVQLRLMISQATAVAPAYASTAEFCDALAYFERPNRDVVLQGVYARATAAPTPAAYASVKPLDTLAPLPSEKHAAPPKPVVPFAGRRVVQVAAAAVAFAALAVAGERLWQRAAGSSGRGRVSQLAADASAKMGGAVLNGMSAVTERLGLGRLAPADAPAGPAPLPPPAATSAPKHVRAASKTVAASYTAFDFDPSVPLVPVGGFQLPVRAELVAPVATAGASIEREPDPIVYTAESPDVVPPIGVRPQLQRDLPSTLSESDLTRLDLLITEDGLVESVKLVIGPSSVHDAMFVSVVKAWQFQPALKQGVPVRYRKTVWIAAQ